jgi:hypothetical protein
MGIGLLMGGYRVDFSDFFGVMFRYMVNGLMIPACIDALASFE